MQNVLYVLILNIILHLTHDIRNAGMQNILCIQFLAFSGGIERNASMHESLVLHCLDEVLASKPGLQGIVDDRLPAERILKERKEFRLLFLAHILLERPSIIII